MELKRIIKKALVVRSFAFMALANINLAFSQEKEPQNWHMPELSESARSKVGSGIFPV
ncbi:hypothetical protein R9C00_13105 [Flammeovirgaceae bacterium SG7u.111]|nr:hypothetical protein [Flammeovirgaceae bacterium SG7u.132]WPO38394.1 hypothetical protein R9C00_13105 [Flammeovirgaceae bacterium SG7u.111]